MRRADEDVAGDLEYSGDIEPEIRNRSQSSPGVFDNSELTD